MAEERLCRQPMGKGAKGGALGSRKVCMVGDKPPGPDPSFQGSNNSPVDVGTRETGDGTLHRLLTPQQSTDAPGSRHHSIDTKRLLRTCPGGMHAKTRNNQG